MKKITDFLFLGFVKLVFLWVIFALSFQLFMLTTMVVNPDLNDRIGKAIMWKLDGTFKNDPDNIWYEGPSK